MGDCPDVSEALGSIYARLRQSCDDCDILVKLVNTRLRRQILPIRRPPELRGSDTDNPTEADCPPKLINTVHLSAPEKHEALLQPFLTSGPSLATIRASAN